MNTYKITATTASGETLSNTVVEVNESKARKAFREIYRHGESYTIDAVQLVSEDSCATKEQERDAIVKIKAILETLGPQSYVATALEGCLEIAEQNIEFDFADSMKGRMESYAQEAADAKRKIANLESDYKDLRLALDKAKQEAADAQQALRDKAITADDLTDCIHLVENKRFEIDTDLKKAAADIVKFADNPSAPDFQQAVKDHRRLDGEQGYYFNLARRLEAVQQAGA